MKAGKWERTKYVGVSLIGKTLAIMGFGKVRRQISYEPRQPERPCENRSSSLVSVPLLASSGCRNSTAKLFGRHGLVPQGVLCRAAGPSIGSAVVRLTTGRQQNA